MVQDVAATTRSDTWSTAMCSGEAPLVRAVTVVLEELLPMWLVANSENSYSVPHSRLGTVSYIKAVTTKLGKRITKYLGQKFYLGFKANWLNMKTSYSFLYRLEEMK